MKDKIAHLVIAPIHKTFFIRSNWRFVNQSRIGDRVTERSKGAIDVSYISFDLLLDKLNDIPKDAFLFYSVSRNDSYRKYISDVIFHMMKMRPDIRYIPNYDILQAYENKGYQDLLMRQIGVTNLAGHYFGDISDFDVTKYTSFPYVVKLPFGAGSSTVALVKSHDELKAFLEKNTPVSIPNYLKKSIKKYMIDKESMVHYSNYYSNRVPFIIQQFIQGLEHDHKVLIFEDKVYTFKRDVRAKDFRASGSKKFTFDDSPGEDALNFAWSVYEKLNVPFISFDVVKQNGESFIIELQGIGFGPIGLLNSGGYYSKNEQNKWTFNEGKSDLDFTYGDALFSYISRTVK